MSFTAWYLLTGAPSNGLASKLQPVTMNIRITPVANIKMSNENIQKYNAIRRKKRRLSFPFKTHSASHSFVTGLVFVPEEKLPIVDLLATELNLISELMFAQCCRKTA